MILTIQARRYTGNRLTWYVNVPKDLRVGIGQARKKFKSRRAADGFAAKLERKRQFRAFLKEFADFGSVCHKTPNFAAVNENGQELPPLMLSDAFAAVIASKKNSGRRKNSIATLTCSLKSFAKACHKPAGDVTPSDVEAWLYAGDYAPKTRKGRHTDLNTAFGWLVKHRMVASNPVAAVEPPAVELKSAETMPVTDVAKLLHTCQKSDPALIGFLALIIFGGLRSKESARALPANVHDGIVDIGGDQTKLNVRRCFPIQPVLAAWLEVPGAEIGGQNIYNRFVALRKAAGVTVPDNGLRHTSVSCWIPILGPEKTAIMHGHSVSTMMKHYAAKVTPEEAKRFIELRPTP